MPFDATGRVGRGARRTAGQYARAAQDRHVLGGEQRDRHPHDCHGLARVLHCKHGARVLRLRRRRSVMRDYGHGAGRRGRQPDALARLDAVFLSVHKFLGGPRAPGLLIADKKLFSNRVPVEPGGGTVLYTSPDEHVYLTDTSHRETGGTPPIVGVIQPVLRSTLKAAIGHQRTFDIEHGYPERALAEWTKEPGIEIPGRPERRAARHRVHDLPRPAPQLRRGAAERLLRRAGARRLHVRRPVRARAARHRRGRPLRIRKLLEQGHCGVKPGWVRVGFRP